MVQHPRHEYSINILNMYEGFFYLFENIRLYASRPLPEDWRGFRNLLAFTGSSSYKNELLHKTSRKAREYAL